MSEFIPPTSANPSPSPPVETLVFILVLAEKKWPIEIEYVEKGVIIEDVDERSQRTVDSACLLISRLA
jgi:hypothetical protein